MLHLFPFASILIGNWATAFYSCSYNLSPRGWMRVAAVSSSGGWVQVTVDSILRLTRVLAPGFELPLILSWSWLEFRWFDTSCVWLRPTDDLSSDGWIRVKAHSILQLTWYPAAGYDLMLIPSCGWLELRWLDSTCGWLILKYIK